MKNRTTCTFFLLSLGVVLLPPAKNAKAFSLRVAPEVEAAAPSLDGTAPIESPLAFGLTGGGSGAPKSAWKAVLYSLLVPGLGDYYAGDKRRAYTFFGVEAAIWTSFVVYRVQGHLREEAYKEFAAAFGGVSGTGHSDDYYKELARFDSSQEYEEFIKSEGRAVLYPDADYERLEQYFLAHRVSDFEPWDWRSTETRLDFRSRRSASRRAYRRSLYSVATALANRVASSFFAVKAVKDSNRSRHAFIEDLHLEFGPPRYHVSDGLQTGVSIVGSF